MEEKDKINTLSELEKIRLSNERRLKSMKWGIRRCQNHDGTLNEEGKKKYLTEKNKEKL